MSHYGHEPIGQKNKKIHSKLHTSIKPKHSKKKWVFLRLLFILFLSAGLVVILYGFYLNEKIRQRIDGQVWVLPAAVYGRMLNLEPGMAYSKKQMINLLIATQYRKVNHLLRVGEFTVQDNSIDMLRRPFNFPDAKEDQVHARLLFHNDRLVQIENLDNQRFFGFFRLDPRLITMLQTPSGEQRLFLPRSSFPESLVNTLLAIEDRHFYQHDGINFYSIGRALLANILAGRTVQGGSTLTQQLVKNLFLNNQRSFWRKANEAYMAILIDHHYSKDKILELYFNEVYLGQNGNDQIRGFPLASLYYFGRPVDELSLDQQAMLVGMVKGASLYNPWRNPEFTLERRNLVLKLLQNQGNIDEKLYHTLSTRPLDVQPKGGVIVPQPAFIEMVRQELKQKLGDKAQHLSGAKIFTTMDPVSQDAAEKAIESGIPALKGSEHDLSDLEGAMVVIDRLSGEIRAIVGGSQPQFSGFNRALQARRSIGSLAKPAIYLSALNQPHQYRFNTWLFDQPLSLELPNGSVWEPKNYSRKFRGQVMLLDGLVDSLNVPTVNLGMSIGLDQISQTMKQLGAPASTGPLMPSMLLGAINLTPLEVAQEYQTIASGGNKATLSALRSVIAADGSMLYQSFPQSERKLSAQASYLVLYGMQEAVKRGTARSLSSEFSTFHLAGKTGTTNDLRDSWFAGIDGKEVTIIWLGRDNNGPTQFTGSTGALTLYRRYLETKPPLPLISRKPAGIVDMNIDSTTGHFICDTEPHNQISTIPVWTEDPDVLCKTSEKTTPPNELKEKSVLDSIKNIF
ncbi:penicillin-binding protein 1B [Candidatus Williamhamiltonella defendens]|uniref:Penicillin-binding protein 1B n=1 Tax=Hamiltonella defensa subsp. Acyrthosiphon pisum (strain 5AT) TaxID=572265 RepID=C4K4T9_HAMD5|nr:bifunctional glycosyl transferase/transpeptidase [Candidatus Hamiltonella defensa]ACQ67582.1 bifunctional penicillin-binding protein 1b: glycosyl transferase (N-terminal); transpeptidase (C-terminal) [Candidatus Hamiltonella defensa 5AT (Acyrthosiphon pisum)]ATW22287.1 penicillin-binding protein 1B [Candidatus Hamiltonella defensa]